MNKYYYSHRKITILLFLAIILLIHQTNIAQKDAPVAGDAAMLINLLRKDYNTIDPNLKEQELVRNRALVISTLKSYLTAAQKDSINENDLFVNAKILYDKYLKLNKKYEYIKAGFQTENDFKTNELLLKELNNTQTDRDSALKLYFEKQWKYDNKELNNIKSVYEESSNKYLSTVIELFIEKYRKINDKEADKYASKNHASAIQKSIPFIGGDLSLDLFIDGLSRFLAKRLKEELTTYVISRVNEWLSDDSEEDKFAELKILLPKTTEFLKTFDADHLTSFIDEIKQYIEDDLNKIIIHSANLAQSPRIAKLIDTHPELDFAFEVLELMPSIKNMKQPVDFFTIIENSRNIIRWKTQSSNLVKHNLANTIHFASLLAHSLTVIESEQTRFVGSDFIGTYSGEIDFYLLFMGFLHQQNSKYYKISFCREKDDKADTISLDSLLRNVMKSYDKDDAENAKINIDYFTSLFQQIGKNTEDVHNKAIEIRKSNKLGKELSAEKLYLFVDGIINLAENTIYGCDTIVNYLISEMKAPKDNQQEGVDLSDKTKPFISVLRTTNEVIFDIKEKKYALGIIKLLELPSNILPSGQDFHAEIYQFVEKIHDTNRVKHMDSWRYVMTRIIAPDSNSIHIKTIEKQYVIKIYGELKRIKAYCKNRKNFIAQDAKIQSKLESILSLLWELSLGEENDVIPVSAFHKSIIDDKYFTNLIMSYYSGLMIDPCINQFAKKMKNFQIEGVNIFNKAEVEEIKRELKALSKLAYNYYILNKDEDIFQKKGTMLQEILLGQKNMLPQKLDYKIHPMVKKMVYLFNDLAVAKDGEEVSQAIENFALPSGSFSIKRKANYNVAVNSFPGILIGADYTWMNGKKFGFSTGFTAPVGLSFTGSKDGQSKGIFIPIIDIAAFTRFHLDGNSKTEPISEFNFENIFSPGIYYHYGFKKNPVSIHVGGQYGPQIKKIDDNGDFDFKHSVYFGLGILIDIPLINIYTNPNITEK